MMVGSSLTLHFPTQYNDVLAMIDAINPWEYSVTRNHYHGKTSRLSPYFSRGVIGLKQVKNSVVKKHGAEACEKFIYELAWREYFQRCWWQMGDGILKDIIQPEGDSANRGVVMRLIRGCTGIVAIDQQISLLVTKGYIHNHARMHIASLGCNFARMHWQQQSQWMYYHLLDGDVASNSLSWQWVAGTFSSKKYWFNQDNLNQFSGLTQSGTFLDVPYERLSDMGIPDPLQDHLSLKFVTWLPDHQPLSLDYSLPLILYNSYNLDPIWRRDESANRVLLLEPSHFKKYPVAEHVMEFILGLAKNIPGIQVVVAEVDAVPGFHKFPRIISKAHPAFRHYPGEKDPVEWMFPEATLKNSFSSFWRSCKETSATDSTT